MKHQATDRHGFTLMELLIVVAILLIIFFLVLVNLRTQYVRANDARRKADLQKIQNAFEESYNDTQCYPGDTILTNCGGVELSPYLRTVPCDPVSRRPYLYVPVTPNRCDGYRLCAALEDKKDPDIARIGCDPISGCGWGAGYNYCVSVGVEAYSATGSTDGSLGPTGTPTPLPSPGTYGCTPGGACNSYSNPSQAGCPVTYQDGGCMYNGVYQCANPANRCTNY